VRVYSNYPQARNEIERDLAELGKKVYAGYQSKRLLDLEQEGKTDQLTTRELTNYDYRVVRPLIQDLIPFIPNEDWLEAEWLERLGGVEGHPPANPGDAWTHRPEVWEPLLEQYNVGRGKSGVRRFSYTYAERLAAGNQCMAALDALGENPSTRQAYISIWNPQIDAQRFGIRRVPCSLGYQITIRDDRVHMHYSMRSCDFHTHWVNDVALAHRLLAWFLDKLNYYQQLRGVAPYSLGSFTHSVGSLHVYAKDVAHVF
jgi:Thymidylate synthase